jgi:hypothetical protein
MHRHWILRCCELHTVLWLLAGLGLALAGELAAAQTPSSSPVRLVVEPTRRALVAGQPAEIQVGLRGSPPVTRAIPGQSDTRRVEAPVRVEKRSLEGAKVFIRVWQ